MESQDRGTRKVRRGTVVSNKMKNTVVVRVDTVHRHPRYSKVVKTSNKFYAHDESNTLNIGDVVDIVECRPMSKLKRWRVTNVAQTLTTAGADAQ